MHQSQAPWWRGAVVYQIYPRSFCDSNGDGIGDLPGITARLEHVAQLGADAIWLSPFYRSPMKDFGYDVSDYCDVDPQFGTLADFDALLARAHALGLKVIIDQVYSHTSDQHPWFIDSCASPKADKADWYVWAPAKADGSPPNNWLSVFGGPAWTWSPRRRQYYLHNFLTGQPDLNFHHPDVRAAILEAARFWLERGVDGLRLDVINFVTHDAALRDNPPAEHRETPDQPYFFQRHLHDISQPQTLAFLTELRRLTNRYPERMMVGEIFDDDALDRQRQYTEPGRLHTAYSFHLLSAQAGRKALFAEAVEAWRRAEGWPSWSIGNHDVPRYPTRLAGPDAGDAQAVALLAALFALRGAAFLYQGDELGLPQAQLRFEDLQDPFARATFTGGAGRDGARTPFPWRHDAELAGFSTAPRAWLPLDPRHRARAADLQAADPASVLAWTRRLIALRKERPALALGEAEVLPTADETLAVLRAQGEARVLCLVNLGDQASIFGLEAGTRPSIALASDGAGLVEGQARLPAHGWAFIDLAAS